MSLSNAFVPNPDIIYCQVLTAFDATRTNRVDSTDPDPLYIADEVATALYLGNSTNPIPIYFNGVPFSSVPSEQFTTDPVTPVSNDGAIVFFTPNIPDVTTEVTAQILKVGNIVTVVFPSWGVSSQAGAPTTITFPALIPVGYRPVNPIIGYVVQSYIIWDLNASVLRQAYVYIYENGNVVWNSTENISPVFVPVYGSFTPVSVTYSLI